MWVVVLTAWYYRVTEEFDHFRTVFIGHVGDWVRPKRPDPSAWPGRPHPHGGVRLSSQNFRSRGSPEVQNITYYTNFIITFNTLFCPCLEVEFLRFT